MSIHLRIGFREQRESIPGFDRHIPLEKQLLKVLFWIHLHILLVFEI